MRRQYDCYKKQVTAMKTKWSSSSSKPDVVQIKNPKSGHYVKIDRTAGRIVSHKKSEGPYKNVPIARKQKWSSIIHWMEMLLRVRFQAIRGIVF